jgi:hypothetical protein
MATLVKIAFATLAPFAMTSCTEGSGVLTQEESLARIPVLEDATVGRGVISAYDAGVIFADVCLRRGENFDHYAYGLRVHNVTRDRESGVFAHDRYRLSVRVSDESCSVLFYSDMPLEQALFDSVLGARSIVRPVPDGIEVSHRPAAEPDGSMILLRIDAPVILAPNSEISQAGNGPWGLTAGLGPVRPEVDRRRRGSWAA